MPTVTAPPPLSASTPTVTAVMALRDAPEATSTVPALSVNASIPMAPDLTAPSAVTDTLPVSPATVWAKMAASVGVLVTPTSFWASMVMAPALAPWPCAKMP